MRFARSRIANLKSILKTYTSQNGIFECNVIKYDSLILISVKGLKPLPIFSPDNTKYKDICLIDYECLDSRGSITGNNETSAQLSIENNIISVINASRTSELITAYGGSMVTKIKE